MGLKNPHFNKQRMVPCAQMRPWGAGAGNVGASGALPSSLAPLWGWSWAQSPVTGRAPTGRPADKAPRALRLSPAGLQALRGGVW